MHPRFLERKKVSLVSMAAALSIVGAASCASAERVSVPTIAAPAAPAVRLGFMGSAFTAFPGGSTRGSVGLSVKRARDTGRVVLASDGDWYLLSADAESTRSVAMVGLLSTGLEARAHVRSSDSSTSSGMVYLDAKGALGNFMVSGRLFSIGDEYGDEASVLGRMSAASGVGVMPVGFAHRIAGLTGGGLGAKVRATDVLSLSGELDWGWSPGKSSSLLSSLGCDLTGILPGVVSIGVQSSLLGVAEHVASASCELSLGSTGLFRASASRQLGLETAPLGCAVSLRNDWERFYLEVRGTGRIPLAAGSPAPETIVGAEVGLAGSGSPRLSVDAAIEAKRVSVGVAVKF